MNGSLVNKHDSKIAAREVAGSSSAEGSGIAQFRIIRFDKRSVSGEPATEGLQRVTSL